MSTAFISQILVALALVYAVYAFGSRLRNFSQLSRPVDQAKPKGSQGSGLLYAYTLGMAPWVKESTRLHAIAYLRGVVFHLGIFLGLAVLIASPWLGVLSQLTRHVIGVAVAGGAIFGIMGLLVRFVETNLKALSTPDDYFAVLIVSLFLGAEALWLFFPQAQTIFYLTSAAMLVYAPLGKIRHCLYFAASRLFYGKFIGSHAALPHSQQGAR